MSELREIHTDTNEYEEPESLLDGEMSSPETPAADQDFDAKIEARRQRIRRKAVRSKRRKVVLMALIFAVLLTMCSREIVMLQAENRALKKQHAQLEQERDRLKRELSNVGNKEYIKDQARKQLRLLDPGEIMFIFEDGSENQEGDTSAEETTESKEEQKEADGEDE